MNYMIMSKTIYKAIAFGIVLAAVAMICVPSAKVFAQYQTNTGDYITATGSTYTSGGSAGGMSGSYDDYDSGYGGNTGTGTSTGNGGNTCVSCNDGQVIVHDSKPVISTEGATDIKSTSALVQGAAHVDSGTASVWFEYGTRISDLDSTTRSIQINPSSTGDSEMITNLKPNTKYYYRIVAHNSTGTCYGAVLSFTTAKSSTVTTTTSTKTKIIKTASASETAVSSDDSIKGSLSAAAANASGGSSFLPSSVLGWLIIIALVFIIVIVVRRIQREAEERKRLEEETKKAKA
ncbi:MAG: fibronectin type III domain-containing protein [Candidatus Pacebacteria bacterium]|nr:fibronectin type III domain-containing protein [Candidatus Paceibacterota bacterium]